MTNNLAFRLYIITLKVNILEKGENMDSYFKAVRYGGDNFDSMLLNYKVRVFIKIKHF